MTAKIYDFTGSGLDGNSRITQAIHPLTEGFDELSKGEQEAVWKAIMALSLANLRSHITEDETIKYMKVLHQFLINDLANTIDNLK